MASVSQLCPDRTTGEAKKSRAFGHSRPPRQSHAEASGRGKPTGAGTEPGWADPDLPSSKPRHRDPSGVFVDGVNRARSIAIATLAAALGVAAACTNETLPPSSPCTESIAGPSYSETIASACFGCSFGWGFTAFSCGSYRVVMCTNVDVFYLQYYDGASGELVAILAGGGAAGRSPFLVCEGGPASFTEPSCVESDVIPGGGLLCMIPRTGSGAGDAGSADAGSESVDAGTDSGSG
jgi:hypothetical protein